LAASGWLKLTVLAPSHLRPSFARSGSALRRILLVIDEMSKAGILVFLRYSQRKIDHRQQHENEGLNQRNKNM
jgi:hypothetical protein